MSTVGSRPSWAVACNTMWCIIFEEKASVPSPSLGTCDSGSGSMSAPSQSTNAEGVSPELELAGRRGFPGFDPSEASLAQTCSDSLPLASPRRVWAKDGGV